MFFLNFEFFFEFFFCKRGRGFSIIAMICDKKKWDNLRNQGKFTFAPFFKIPRPWKCWTVAATNAFSRFYFLVSSTSPRRQTCAHPSHEFFNLNLRIILLQLLSAGIENWTHWIHLLIRVKVRLVWCLFTLGSKVVLIWDVVIICCFPKKTKKLTNRRRTSRHNETWLGKRYNHEVSN